MKHIPRPPKESKIVAQYPKIESIGSIGSIILAIFEVQVFADISFVLILVVICIYTYPKPWLRCRVQRPYTVRALSGTFFAAPSNYPLRDPKYHLVETIRPLMELHWGVFKLLGHNIDMALYPL